MNQFDLAAPQALAALLLQATCGSFALLWLMPPEAGRQFYSTIGKSLSPIAWIVASSLTVCGLTCPQAPSSLSASWRCA
jgi:hypothetical protein